jgi:hypothetical protein
MTMVTLPACGVDSISPTNPRNLRYKYSAGGFNVLPTCRVFMTVGMNTDNGPVGGNRTVLLGIEMKDDSGRPDSTVYEWPIAVASLD